MKKFTSLLMACSLALAGAALAQQPEEQPSPKKGKQDAETTQTAVPKSGANAEATSGKKPGGAGKGAKIQATSEANAANPEATTATKQGGGTKAERRALKGQKPEVAPKSGAAASTESNVSGQPGTSPTPNEKPQANQGKKGRNARGANATTSPSVSPATAAASAAPVAAPSASASPVTTATASASPVTTATASASPAATATASAAPTVAAAGQQNMRANAKRPDPQQVQQIKTEHASFRAQPRPDKVPTVTFNQSYRIEGSDRWQGPQYEVFRSYHPERHDQGWYRSRYQRVELIGGGYYYMNNGYWYPAWGYNPSNEYYAYDGPIYVGHRAEPPDRVIADVQAVLQHLGYYRGEVDGLLGPLTRQALTAYQAEIGLTPTAAIDEPTLDALGMG